MANEEVLGPRKTMFVLVIVVGCFAVLWPRILSPLILGHTREQLKPNQLDRAAGCCEVIFETEVAVLELLNEVCSSVVQGDGKLSPFAAAECRKAVNDTCGVDIAAFLKRDENVGRNTKKLVDIMKSSNSSCLKEHFGVPQWSMSSHLALNSWTQQDTLKQERPPMRTGPHPALRERGRAIPPAHPGAPEVKRSEPVSINARVRSSPLAGYYELDVKPPPIPGMRPPLGSPGGPVASPKSSMGFVMPIYTICIIVFFVYTLSKIMFKRGSVPYESVSPDPQFRRRVFRDDSRTSPDKLGPKERDTIVTAISGLVAEVQQQMEASYAQNQQRQELQDNQTRPYTNGTVLHNTGPVHIVASEYKEKSPAPAKEPTPEPKESSPEPIPEPKDSSEPKDSAPESKEPTPEDSEEDKKEESSENEKNETVESRKDDEKVSENKSGANGDIIKLTEAVDDIKQKVAMKASEDFLKDARDNSDLKHVVDEKSTAPDLLEEALKEEAQEEVEEEEVEEEVEAEEEDQDKSSVKVVGMEVTAHTADGGSWRPAPARPAAPAPAPPRHEADQVQSIFLETEIPQQARVLVAEFGDRAKPAHTNHSPMVVSGKMTLSLIQDAPRETPDRDLESTVDEFTTASAVTQPAAEKDGELSEEEVDEEIEVEEIEEEVEEVEEVEEEIEDDEEPPKK